MHVMLVLENLVFLYNVYQAFILKMSPFSFNSIQIDFFDEIMLLY